MGVRVVTDSACDLPDDLIERAGHRGRAAHDPVRRRGAHRPQGAHHRASSGAGWTSSPVLPETAAPFGRCVRGDLPPARRRRRRPASSASTSPRSCPARCSRRRSPPRRSRGPARSRSSTRCSVSMGLGNLALTAARLAANGDGLESIVADVLERRSRTKLFGALDTLEYLKKGGRVGERPGAARLDALDQARHRGAATAPSRKPARSAPARRRCNSSPTGCANASRSRTWPCSTRRRPTSTSSSSTSIHRAARPDRHRARSGR